MMGTLQDAESKSQFVQHLEELGFAVATGAERLRLDPLHTTGGGGWNSVQASK